MHRRLLIVGVIVAQALSGCAQIGRQHGNFNACVAGQSCTVVGRLSLHAGQPPAWVALLETGDECAKFALPESFFDNKEDWNGKEIEVTGRAFLQPVFDESNGIATLWYTERDRKLAMGMCDQGVGIYVDSMQSSAAKKWP